MRKLSMDELNRKTITEFIDAKKFPVTVILENIRSAYNVGSVFRTADSFLIESIIITGYTATPPHKEIKKTALGAEDSVQWKFIKETQEAIKYLREENYLVFAVEQASESISLEKINFSAEQKIAFVFGNEVSGVDDTTIALCDGCIEIPQFGVKHSLNISVAAGIVLWETVRSRIIDKEL